MIPERIIDKAARAMKASRSDDEWRNDVWDAPYVNNARAALEAAAADIWDQGYQAGFSDGPFICACNAWNDGECACGNYGNGETPEPNPYRIEHA